MRRIRDPVDPARPLDLNGQTVVECAILQTVREQIEQRLSVLLGLPLWAMGRAADLEWFHFGGQREVVNRRGEKKAVGDWALHVQCPWRIVHMGKILVASADLYYPAGIHRFDDLELADEGGWAWDRNGPRRLDERTAALQQLLDTDPPTVEGVQADAVGSLRISFSGGYMLELFPNGTLDDQEHWRFFEPYRDKRHFVVGAAAVAQG